MVFLTRNGRERSDFDFSPSRSIVLFRTVVTGMMQLQYVIKKCRTHLRKLWIAIAKLLFYRNSRFSSAHFVKQVFQPLVLVTISTALLRLAAGQTTFARASTVFDCNQTITWLPSERSCTWKRCSRKLTTCVPVCHQCCVTVWCTFRC